MSMKFNFDWKKFLTDLVKCTFTALLAALGAASM